MPTATVHKQISERERIKYGTAQNPRGLILDIVEDHWPAGPSLTGIFSADGSQTFAEGNHPVAEVKYVLKGELKVVIEGGEHVLVPGDLLSVPKGSFIGWQPCAYEVLLFTQRAQAYPPARL